MREYLLKRMWSEEDGQDLTEYVLIMVLISLLAITVLRGIGLTLANAFSTASSNMASAQS